jgi:hypothetical protein
METRSLEQIVTAVHDVAEPATYVASISLLVLEVLVLRLLGRPVSHRSGRMSLLSGAAAFGGMAVVQGALFATAGL